MSLLYKRPDSPFWYVTKTRESTKTVNRKDAEEFTRKSLKAHWRAEELGDVSYNWDMLAEMWLDRKEGHASIGQDRMVIECFSDLLRRRNVESLEAVVNSDIIPYYGKVVKARASASTANRHLGVIRAMLRAAAAKKWIRYTPTIENFKTTRVEVKPLTIEQADAVIANLPGWAADMVVFALQTGLRQANVIGLQWAWVSPDLGVVTVPAVHTKSARTYTIPLSTLAKEIVARLRVVRADAKYVFGAPKRIGKRRLRNGGQRDQSKEAKKGVFITVFPPNRHTIHFVWKRACEIAGVPDARWHDLRHTWASRHLVNGTPERHLAKMGGWQNTRMLDVYGHLKTEHLAAYADNVNPS